MYKNLKHPMKIMVSIEADNNKVIQLHSEAIMSRKRASTPLIALFDEIKRVVVEKESWAVNGETLHIREPRAGVFVRVAPLTGSPLRTSVIVGDGEPDDKRIGDLYGAVRRLVVDGIYVDCYGKLQQPRDSLSIRIRYLVDYIKRMVGKCK